VLTVNRERKCHNCNENVWSKGGLREWKGKDHCLECFDKIKEKSKKRKNQKNFVTGNWSKWIGFGLTIVGLIIAYFAFLG